MQEVLAPVSRTASRDRVEDGDPVVERVKAALARRHPGHDVGPVLQHLAGVELALAAGDARGPRAACRGRSGCSRGTSAARAAATAFCGRLVERGRRLEARLLEEAPGLLGVRPDDPDDHRDVALLAAPGLDQPAGHLVAAGDAAEDVDEDRLRPSGRRG